jgi:hypothetical protein
MKGWSKYPETDADTLDMADMLIGYLERRAPRREGGTRRAVFNSATFRALQLLNVQRRKGQWYLRWTWRSRLELAGIDPETMEVVEPRRWARAWLMLSTTWRFRKADAIRGNALDSDAPWPPEPIIRGLKHHPSFKGERRAGRPPGKTQCQVFSEEEEEAKPRDLMSRFRTNIHDDS